MRLRKQSLWQNAWVITCSSNQPTVIETVLPISQRLSLSYIWVKPRIRLTLPAPDIPSSVTLMDSMCLCMCVGVGGTCGCGFVVSTVYKYLFPPPSDHHWAEDNASQHPSGLNRVERRNVCPHTLLQSSSMRGWTSTKLPLPYVHTCMSYLVGTNSEAVARLVSIPISTILHQTFHSTHTRVWDLGYGVSVDTCMYGTLETHWIPYSAYSIHVHKGARTMLHWVLSKSTRSVNLLTFFNCLTFVLLNCAVCSYGALRW